MNNLPLYIEFANILRSKIESHEYNYGDQLPTESEFSSAYNIDKKTIRRAKKILVDEGLICCIKGKGSFVNKPKIPVGTNGVVGFTSINLKNGFLPENKILVQAPRKANSKFARLFSISNDDLVYHIMRIRSSDGIPIAVEDTYIPYSLIPHVEKYDFSLHSLINVMLSNNIELTKAKTSIETTISDPYFAKLLDIQANAPMFIITYQIFDTNGCVEYTHSYTSDNRIIFMKES